MRSLFAHKSTVCRPERLFEELEDRIVLDASVDSASGDAPLHAADAAAHWNLAYSSAPSTHMDHVLDAAALAAYPVDLALSPAPGFDTTHMGPILPTAPGGVADLSGAVRIVGTSSVDMVVVVDFNPLKLSETSIDNISFTENADSGVTITAPGSGDTDTTTWQIVGAVDAVNAILATMQATMDSAATSPGHFMVSVTDSDYDTADTRSDSAFVVQNFYIPLANSTTTTTTTDDSTSGSSTSSNSSATLADIVTYPTEVDLNGVDTGAPMFTGTNAVVIEDPATPVIDVGIRVVYGTLSTTDPNPTGVQIIQRPYASSLAMPPGVASGNDWTAGWLYVRGNVDRINDWLETLVYTRFPTHGTVGASTAVDDHVTIDVDDRGTNGNPPWWGNPIGRNTSVTLPIYYITV
jgi:hypothetical protein